MAHVISDECMCGCLARQNVQLEQSLREQIIFEIDADACVDCGACAAQCPTGAISQG